MNMYFKDKAGKPLVIVVSIPTGQRICRINSTAELDKFCRDTEMTAAEKLKFTVNLRTALAKYEVSMIATECMSARTRTDFGDRLGQYKIHVERADN